ncbi:hypothetical protein COO60DRAFT_940689 [Scenedesmus sp. NREL 46B-D3]|nr:hypothetical protein COO60DRAFT_940689 [Scenedesmus sp. NREL 46B-D3]
MRRPGLGEGGPLGAGGAAGGQLRLVDTEAYSHVTRPGSHVTIMGNSVELLSFPGEGPDGVRLESRQCRRGSGSGSQLGVPRAGISTNLEQAGLSSGVVQQWAAVISIMGSRWSSPLVLAAAGGEGAGPGSAGEAAAPVAEAVARLPRYRACAAARQVQGRLRVRHHRAHRVGRQQPAAVHSGAAGPPHGGQQPHRLHAAPGAA